MAPSTRYARSGDASIAYQVAGEGALDLLFLPGWISQVEQLWEAPAMRRFLERLAVFNRLILFDRRGTGLSDRTREPQTARAGRRATRSPCSTPRAANARRCFTYSLGGLVGAMLAAEHPERIGALIMYASVARTSWAPDYDWALTHEERERADRTKRRQLGRAPTARSLQMLAPSMADDQGLIDWFARMQRLAASPAEARSMVKAMVDLDVREIAAARPRADARDAPQPRHGVGRAPLALPRREHRRARATSSSTAPTRSRSSATATRSSRRSRSSSPADGAAARSHARC